MIVKDEEDVLARCLECVAPFADEIVIADTGSTDGTVTIARIFTDKVYSFPWCDDFAAARNFSFSKANCDLIMWLDADDVITEENAAKIALLKNAEDFDVAFLKYAAAFDGDVPTFVYYRERIFRRSLGLQWKGEVHEVIEPAGRIIYSDACVYHKKVKTGDRTRNLRIYQNLISKGVRLDPRQKFYYGRELFFNGLYPESVAVLQDYLDGEGWVENKIEACRTLYKALLILNRRGEAVSALLRAFSFSSPRAEDCCALGEYFAEQNDVRSAIYWYECALRSGEKAEDGGFVNLDYLSYIPAMCLCVLYAKLGDYARAQDYNEMAGKAKPQDKNYLYNKKFFQLNSTERK